MNLYRGRLKLVLVNKEGKEEEEEEYVQVVGASGCGSNQEYSCRE